MRRLRSSTNLARVTGVIVLGFVLLGSSMAVASTNRTTKTTLVTPNTRTDIEALQARENALAAQLARFQHVNNRSTLTAWEVRLKTLETGQTKAETVLSADLASSASGVSGSHVIFETSGTGAGSTAPFTIPSSKKQWQLYWHFDCSQTMSGAGGRGNFMAFVDKGTNLDEAAANTIGTQGSATEHFYDTGTFNLSINSTCAWSIKVTA